MTEPIVFAIGSIVFAITIWGTVMAGGIALTRVEIEQNPEFKKKADKKQLRKRFPTRLKY